MSAHFVNYVVVPTLPMKTVVSFSEGAVTMPDSVPAGGTVLPPEADGLSVADYLCQNMQIFLDVHRFNALFLDV